VQSPLDLTPASKKMVSPVRYPQVPPTNPENSQWFSDNVLPHESELRGYLRRKFLQFDVDDIVQETYARLFRAKEKSPLRSVRAFLFTTARNAAVDIYRRRQIVTIDGVANFESISVFEDKPDAFECLCQDQELVLLAEAIESLPDRCRCIVKLRKLEGLSHREIAQRLGIAESTVNAQITNGILKLREFLSTRGFRRSAVR